MFASSGAFTSFREIAELLLVLQRFRKNRIRAGGDDSSARARPLSSKLSTARASVRAMSRKSLSRFAAAAAAIFSFISSGLTSDLPGEMSAAFRKFLVFDVATGQTRALKFLDRPRRVFRAAETSVRIDDARNFHRPRNVTGELRHFRQREQTDVRHARGRIAQTRATNIERIESAPLDHADPSRR